MQRTLSAFDAPKRADWNFRTEWLDLSREMYVGRTNKLQVSQLDFLSDAQRAHPNLARPPKQRMAEQLVHPRLEGKERWNISTEALTQKQLEQLTQAQLARSRASRSAGSTRARESLQEREARFLEERRAEKRAAAQMRAVGLTPPKEEKPSFFHLTREDFAEMSVQVPAKRVTSWSLGSI